MRGILDDPEDLEDAFAYLATPESKPRRAPPARPRGPLPVAYVSEPAERFLHPEAVRDRLGLSKTTLWRLVKAGQFPAPVTLTAGRMAWLESEVVAWMAAKVAERDQIGPRAASTIGEAA